MESLELRDWEPVLCVGNIVEGSKTSVLIASWREYGGHSFYYDARSVKTCTYLLHLIGEADGRSNASYPKF